MLCDIGVRYQTQAVDGLIDLVAAIAAFAAHPGDREVRILSAMARAHESLEGRVEVHSELCPICSAETPVIVREEVLSW